MRDDAKADELIDPLREAFAKNLREAFADLPAHQALQMADALCGVQMEVLAGLRVTYRSPAPVDSAGIAEAWRKGASLAEVMRTFAVSRTTAYKHHPNRDAGRRRRA